MRGALAPVALAAVAAGLLLSACASTPTAKSRPSARTATKPHGKPPAHAQATAPARPQAQRQPLAPEQDTLGPFYPPAPRRATSPLKALPGWADEDHLAALSAFQVGCTAAREAAMRPICAAARAMRTDSDAEARDFFEDHFRAEAVPETPGTPGMLTAYFAPEYEARPTRDTEFSAPVRPRPTGMVTITVAAPALAPAPDPDDLIGEVLSETAFEAPAETRPQRVDLSNAERSVIDRSPADGALAWMRPEDLFFLQIQGSGVLTFPDGRRLKAAYTADNGKPFVAIARPMVNQGLLRGQGASGDAIRGWLASHRGAEADKVMWLNPRYVFFVLSSDDGREPAGAAGIPLPAGRAIAVDPSRHAYGEVFWIDAEAPVLAGAAKTYRRLAMALDTGAAIRGQVRADLYIGRGAAAGNEAGRVRHNLRMTRLVPIGSEQRGSARSETPASTGGG